MLKSALALLTLAATVFFALAARNPPSAEKSGEIILRYMGTAAWEISDGTTVILIDPYLSRINRPRPPGAGSAGAPIPGDARPFYGWDHIAVPDVTIIDSHIQRADFTLVTHTHYELPLMVYQKPARKALHCFDSSSQIAPFRGRIKR